MAIANFDQISIVENRNETANIPSNSSFRFIRERKFLWILFSLILIVSAVISTVLIMKKKMTVNATTTISTLITTTTTTTTENESFDNISIANDMKWKQNGTTVAGGNGKGNKLNQLSSPHSLYVDDNQTVYVADTSNDRIVKWTLNVEIGQVVAGGNERGNRLDQLNSPITVIVDKENDSLIICDLGNQRVMRWSRQNNTNGEIIIANILCYDLAMDNEGDLYVADLRKGEVKKWRMGDTDGLIVAGGNGLGNHLNQLSVSCNIFVDQDYSVYVSDWNNNRVMKWVQDTKEGVVVAGGQNDGYKLQQLQFPMGIFVDQMGSVFVADYGYDRIVRWLKEANLGSTIIGEFRSPNDVSFDEQNNMYVVDSFNHRVQKFDIDSN